MLGVGHTEFVVITGLVANSFLFFGFFEVAQFTGDQKGILVFILQAELFDFAELYIFVNVQEGPNGQIGF